jgi:hypothetical protein
MGESNAESVERTDAIEAEYKLRVDPNKQDQKEENVHTYVVLKYTVHVNS